MWSEGRWLVLALRSLLVLVVLGAGGAAFWKMHQQVEQKLAYPTTPARIVLKNVPEWMSDSTSDAIARSVAPKVQRSALDAQFLRDIADVLSGNPWVKKVHRVRRLYGASAGDTIEIECEYRAPAAFVSSGGDFVLIDAEGYRLPERFPVSAGNPRMMFTEEGRLALRIIDGVASPPPQPGRKWAGDDLAAGLDMLRILFEQACAEDIERVDVTNFNCRAKPREAQIVLHTRYRTQIRWGEPPRRNFHTELAPAEKLDRLNRIVARYGRVDANHSWLDIRLDKILFPAQERVAAITDQTDH